MLTAANSGVAVVDGLMLRSAKEKLQLAEALSRGHIVLGAGRKAAGAATGSGTAGLVVPMTATVWAAATPAWRDPGGLEGGPLGGGAGAGKGAGGKGVAAEGAMRHDGFNLVLLQSQEDERAAEDAVVSAALGRGGAFPGAPGMVGGEVGSGGAGAAVQGTGFAAEFLRQHMCAARCRPSPPRFSGDALSLLQRYVVSVRQSAVGPHVPHAQIVATLVAAARGCAALLGRQVVMCHPDCVVAVLLQEATLGAR